MLSQAGVNHGSWCHKENGCSRLPKVLSYISLTGKKPSASAAPWLEVKGCQPKVLVPMKQEEQGPVWCSFAHQAVKPEVLCEFLLQHCQGRRWNLPKKKSFTSPHSAAALTQRQTQTDPQQQLGCSACRPSPCPKDLPGLATWRAPREQRCP